MIKQYLSIALTMTLATACAKQDLGVIAAATAISSCDNTFIVSSDTWIKLFEHGLGSVNTKLVSDISVPEKGVGVAQFLCGRNEIVNNYSYRGRGGVLDYQDEGIEIRPLNGRMERYPFDKDGTSSPIPYRNGVLFDTTLLHKELIDPSLGFLTKHEQSTDKPLAVEKHFFGDKKDKEQATHHVFTWMHFFDLDQRKVTRSYRRDVSAGDWLEGDDLVTRSAALMSMNLKTGHRKAIYEFDPEQDGVPHNEMQILRVHGKFYAVTSSRVGKVDGLPLGFPRKFRKSTIYALDVESGKWRAKVKLPYDDITYTVDRGDSIYVFTRTSGKVLHYDVKANKLNEISFDTGGKAVIAASHTTENFILVLGWQPQRHGEYRTMPTLMVVSTDFKQHSQPVDLEEVGYVRITTQQRPKEEGFSGRLYELGE